ncbi:MAG: SPOR domain-containing protein [Gammaproteobacteria bacterium]|nr:SPOR domain-containing protein [Gammaproteobacteria bacterium]
MADAKKTPNNNFILLSLGCLIGFLFGFVLLLANLPGYEPSSDYSGRSADNFRSSASGFEFYSLLPGLKSETADVEDDDYRPSVPRFRSRVEPVEVRPLEKKDVLEVPASYASEAYFLQAGSFSQQADAEKMRAKLLLSGLDAFIKPFEKDGKLHHRVRLGPYYDKSDLQNARDSLQSRGISYMVLRVKG